MPIFKKLSLTTFSILLLISPTLPPFQSWVYDQGTLFPVPHHPNQRLFHTPSQADLNNDGIFDCLQVVTGQAWITTGACRGSSSAPVIWNSPPSWHVTEARITDLNRDGQWEVTLLVWRPFKPWPIDRYLPHSGRIQGFHDSSGQSCHLILVAWNEGGFRERWAGSALVDPVVTFAVADLDDDGHQELVTLEGDYQAPQGAPASYLAIWEWNGFGFSLLTRTSGSFSKVWVSTVPDGKTQLLTLASHHILKPSLSDRR